MTSRCSWRAPALSLERIALSLELATTTSDGSADCSSYMLTGLKLGLAFGIGMLESHIEVRTAASG